MASAHDHTIGSFFKGTEDEHGIDTAGTWNTDDLYIRRIAQTAASSKVCSGVTAPVTAECHDLWSEFFLCFYRHIASTSAIICLLEKPCRSIAPDGQVGQSALAYNKIEVPQGGEYTLVLNDGTKVHLNSMSSLRFPLTFEAGKREVELAGEAYFEVSANKNKPFYVHTSKGEIKVLGTHFNLEAYSNADVFKTSLFEGKVRVRVKGNNIYLKPDQMVCYHKNGKIHLETIHDYDQFRWREGLICIKSAKLKDIMKTFTKYFGDSIVIQNKEVEHYKYTGKFRQSRGVINALRLLQKDAPFTIEQDEDKQIIYIK